MTTDSKLAENVLHFGRTLRKAGMPVGPGRVMTAIEALRHAGIERREDFYWTLHACFVTRQDQRELFDQAFHAFWKDPQLLERIANMLQPPELPANDTEEGKEKARRRIAEAFSQGMPEELQKFEQRDFDLDTSNTWSAEETFKTMDFEEMSVEDLSRARRAIHMLHMPQELVKTRRYKPSPHGKRIDAHGSLRASLQYGGDIIPLKWKGQIERPAPITVLCDISGSMSQYSRMILHFLHTLGSERDRLSSFVFGTRLTNITRHLKRRDVDEALSIIGTEVTDWDGGTTIGACLHDFNRDWSRRVLRSDSIVLLVTDGLDRENVEMLSREAERLQKSCKRLVWLNPLLRFDGFAPKARGIRALLPHVDEFRAVHNIKSIEELVATLTNPSSAFTPERYLKQMQNQ